MKKKLLSLLLALCLVMALVPMTAFAEGTSVDNWDGSADTSWYTSAPDASEYHISTAEQLAGLAQLVNTDPGTTNFAGKTFYLENDLDLSGHEWISIGTVLGGDYPEYSFCGVFDGQGHVISNLYSHESYIEGADESHNLLRNALFGSVYNGEVKNLGVANAEIWIDPKDNSAAGKGILVDWMGKSKITNCWTSGSIYSGTKIEKNIGGIVGVTVQGCTISGCYSTATLTGNFTNSEGYYTDPQYLPPDTIGGIVGARFDGNLTVTDCWFGGKIVVNSILAAVGGIVGYADTATVKNCMVVTKDIGRDSVTEEVNTCWVAYALGGTVENCYWPNDEKAYDPSPLAYVGGQSNEEQGTAITDFTSADVLTGLRTNAGTGIEWVAGINHPTFAWDVWHIPADYTKFIGAIAAFLKEVETSPFSDVSTSAYYYEAVKWAQEKGITGGIGNGLFGPNQPCTRAQIVTFLWRATGSPVVNYAMNMSDVPEGSYYAEAVRWALSEGITTGTTENTFSPDSECTRAQAVAFLFRYAASEAVTLQELVSGFSDADSVPGYALPAMNWALAEEIVQGNGSKLMPNDSCTRAQIVTFLFRAYQGK